MDKDSLLDRLNDWMAISKNGVLKELFDIFQNHKEYCEKQSLLAIRKSDHDNAIRWEAKAEDAEAIETKIRKHIETLRKEK